MDGHSTGHEPATYITSLLIEDTLRQPLTIQKLSCTHSQIKAYSAITFFNSDNNVASIMVKALVAPLKSTTLPRLG